MDGLIFGKKKKNTEFDRQLSSAEMMQEKEITAQESAAEGYLMDLKEKNQELTKWQQDLEPFLLKMVHRLRREVKDETGKYKPITVNGKPLPPLCTDELIYNLVALLEPSTSPNMMMSNFDENQIYQQIVSNERTVILDLLIPEMKKYGTPRHQLSEVKKIFRAFMYPTMFRAWKGGERKHLGTIRTVKELHSDNQEVGKKKGIFGI